MPPFRCANGTAPEISRSQIELAFEFAAPADVVQRRLRRQAERAQQPPQHRLRNGAAHVDFVDAGDRLARADDRARPRPGSGSVRPSRSRLRRSRTRRRIAPGPAGTARRPRTGRSAGRSAPSAISMAHCSSTCGARQFGRRVRAEHEAHAARLVPAQAFLAQRLRAPPPFPPAAPTATALSSGRPIVAQRLLREHAVDHAHAEACRTGR